MINIFLFLQFVKYGILCFGGGYVLIPLLFFDFVEKTPVFSPDEFGNLLVLSQMTPGAVSINTATYVGYLKSTLSGAFFASFGLVLHSVILTTLILNFMHTHQQSSYIQGFLKGGRWISFVMVLYAIILFANMSVFKEPLNFEKIVIGLKNFNFDWFTLNYIEFYIMILSIILYKLRFSMTIILFFSAFLGGFISYIKWII